MFTNELLESADIRKHVVGAAEKRENGEVGVTERASLNAVATEYYDVISKDICRVSHPGIECLPHLPVVKCLLDLDHWLDLLPILQNHIVDPNISHRSGL